MQICIIFLGFKTVKKLKFIQYKNAYVIDAHTDAYLNIDAYDTDA